MFFGKYFHNLDEKNRLTIPSKLKLHQGDKLFLIRGFDGCLSVYKEEDFETFMSSLNSLPYTQEQTRKMQRLGYSSVVDLEIDKANRISIPTQVIKEYDVTKEIVVVGVYNHIELWNKSAWVKYEAENASHYEEIAEKLPL